MPPSGIHTRQAPIDLSGSDLRDRTGTFSGGIMKAYLTRVLGLVLLLGVIGAATGCHNSKTSADTTDFGDPNMDASR